MDFRTPHLLSPLYCKHSRSICQSLSLLNCCFNSKIGTRYCYYGERTLDELRQALELANYDELKQITQILFSRRFNPLDYLHTPDPIQIQSQSHRDWIDSLEKRFRYLAADGITVLRRKTQQVSYREALIRVCHYLKIPYSPAFSTTDIEIEIFLHLAQKAWKRLPCEERKSLSYRILRRLDKLKLPEPITVQLQNNSFPLLLKGSGILAVSSLVTPLLKQIPRQFALYFTKASATKAALKRGGAVVAVTLGARRGIAISAVRCATPTILGFVGPLLTGSFLVDLSWRSIATNYSRIIPTIVALAQIRLIRAECWELA